jgi:hypothetical protein
MTINQTALRTAVNDAITAWDSSINAIGVNTTFTLHTGETFTIKTVRRKKPDENMTEGLQQKGFEIQFMAKNWVANAPAGRHPEKGDQLSMAGRRHAIESSKLVEAAGVSIGYIARVMG